MTQFYWGLDPGNTGAIAVIADDQILFVENLPLLTIRKNKRNADLLDLASMVQMVRELKKNYPPTMATIESVWAHGESSAISNFVMGGTSYTFETLCMVYSIRHQLIAPQTWKPSFKLRSGAEKDESIQVVQRLHPGTCELLAPWHKSQNRRNKPNHDRAEAVLLAAYGQRQDQQGLPNAQKSPLPAVSDMPLVEAWALPTLEVSPATTQSQKYEHHT